MNDEYKGDVFYVVRIVQFGLLKEASAAAFAAARHVSLLPSPRGGGVSRGAPPEHRPTMTC